MNESVFYYCKSTSSRLAGLIGVSEFNPYAKAQTEIFSEQDKAIIRLICQEKTSEEIGKILFIGKRQVERIRTKIISRMNVKSPAGVVMYAIKNSIYDVGSDR